jgi:hypothetical protein
MNDEILEAFLMLNWGDYKRAAIGPLALEIALLEAKLAVDFDHMPADLFDAIDDSEGGF